MLKTKSRFIPPHTLEILKNKQFQMLIQLDSEGFKTHEIGEFFHRSIAWVSENLKKAKQNVRN